MTDDVYTQQGVPGDLHDPNTYMADQGHYNRWRAAIPPNQAYANGPLTASLATNGRGSTIYNEPYSYTQNSRSERDSSLFPPEAYARDRAAVTSMCLEDMRQRLAEFSPNELRFQLLPVTEFSPEAVLENIESPFQEAKYSLDHFPNWHPPAQTHVCEQAYVQRHENLHSIYPDSNNAANLGIVLDSSSFSLGNGQPYSLVSSGSYSVNYSVDKSESSRASSIPWNYQEEQVSVSVARHLSGPTSQPNTGYVSRLVSDYPSLAVPDYLPPWHETQHTLQIRPPFWPTRNTTRSAPEVMMTPGLWSPQPTTFHHSYSLASSPAYKESIYSAQGKSSNRCPDPTCEFHREGFKFLGLLRRHICNHHLKQYNRGQVGKNDSLELVVEFLRLVYVCPFEKCARAFYRLDTLLRHQRVIHAQTKDEIRRAKRAEMSTYDEV